MVDNATRCRKNSSTITSASRRDTIQRHDRRNPNNSPRRRSQGTLQRLSVPSRTILTSVRGHLDGIRASLPTIPQPILYQQGSWSNKTGQSYDRYLACPSSKRTSNLVGLLFYVWNGQSQDGCRGSAELAKGFEELSYRRKGVSLIEGVRGGGKSYMYRGGYWLYMHAYTRHIRRGKQRCHIEQECKRKSFFGI
jgi:hypothetical protein